ncbi:MAG: hypothetical protein HZT40_02990 [Candidatus Thiothrix singaporensis]|uniref:Uncharacterized protein n=1 Tax=Candidatus Thiothrix singaporensis TaxID=2799669 RepID=A0A7L6ANQ1_9GAMM|nr:MAG: hypothetical protein HZT40_02990 [Candidatus Thiothrix singaporensis]
MQGLFEQVVSILVAKFLEGGWVGRGGGDAQRGGIEDRFGFFLRVGGVGGEEEEREQQKEGQKKSRDPAPNPPS